MRIHFQGQLDYEGRELGSEEIAKALWAAFGQRVQMVHVALTESELPHEPTERGTTLKKPVLDAGLHHVICQRWDESEVGWGVRPDGYSLHLDKQHLADYISGYWAGMPGGQTPSEYSRPTGEPYLCVVDDETFKKTRESGLRRYDSNYPQEAS